MLITVSCWTTVQWQLQLRSSKATTSKHHICSAQPRDQEVKHSYPVQAAVDFVMHAR